MLLEWELTNPISGTLFIMIFQKVLKVITRKLVVVGATAELLEVYFAGHPDEQVKVWQRVIATDVVNDTGIIEIRIYHPERVQADQIIRTLDQVSAAVWLAAATSSEAGAAGSASTFSRSSAAWASW